MMENEKKTVEVNEEKHDTKKDDRMVIMPDGLVMSYSLFAKPYFSERA